MQYRKKPVIIEAVQLRWSTWNEVCDFLGDVIDENNPGRRISVDEVSDTCGESGPDYIELDVTTTHGETAVVRHGDWIIPDSKPGTFYPCKPDVFAATYEAVEPIAGEVPNEDSFTIDQNGCARCRGEGHKQITFRKLTYPLAGLTAHDGVIPTYWASCPTNGEPILMTVRPHKD